MAKNDLHMYRTVAHWSAIFRDGRESLEDDPRSGRPITETAEVNIQRVNTIVEENPRVTYDDIEPETGLSRCVIHSILHDHLGLNKRASRWIPHMLSQKKKSSTSRVC